MKNNFALFIILLFAQKNINAQVFQVDTLQYNGDIEKYINIVIMGDGYTSGEQVNFIADANNLSNYLFTQTPWLNYSSYFNVFAIKVISSQSGITHPGNATDVSEPVFPITNTTTYFDCTFDCFGIHRLVVPQNTTNIMNALSVNFPNYDQVLIIANSTEYGGSGGSYATSTINASSDEIIVHEVGHSFANLADEYYAGDNYAGEMANMTQETNPLLVKWKNWMGFNGTGIYQHCCGGNSAMWNKPANNCKMEYIGGTFCNVCSQEIVESIHNLVNPIVSYIPTTMNINSSNQLLDFKLTELMKPISNTLTIKWQLDGSTIAYNLDSVEINQNLLATGLHTLVATVVDTTHFLRIDNHSSIHFSTVTWTINKVITGIELTSDVNKISYSVFPNPTSNFLTIEFELEKKSNVSIELISIDGKIIQQLENKILDSGKYSKIHDIENIPVGSYTLLFKIDNSVYKETIIKH